MGEGGRRDWRLEPGAILDRIYRIFQDYGGGTEEFLGKSPGLAPGMG
jgi:hypothetical protein